MVQLQPHPIAVASGDLSQASTAAGTPTAHSAMTSGFRAHELHDLPSSGLSSPSAGPSSLRGYPLGYLPKSGSASGASTPRNVPRHFSLEAVGEVPEQHVYAFPVQVLGSNADSGVATPKLGNVDSHQIAVYPLSATHHIGVYPLSIAGSSKSSLDLPSGSVAASSALQGASPGILAGPLSHALPDHSNNSSQTSTPMRGQTNAVMPQLPCAGTVPEVEGPPGPRVVPLGFLAGQKEALPHHHPEPVHFSHLPIGSPLIPSTPTLMSGDWESAAALANAAAMAAVSNRDESVRSQSPPRLQPFGSHVIHVPSDSGSGASTPSVVLPRDCILPALPELEALASEQDGSTRRHSLHIPGAASSATAGQTAREQERPLQMSSKARRFAQMLGASIPLAEGRVSFSEQSSTSGDPDWPPLQSLTGFMTPSRRAIPTGIAAENKEKFNTGAPPLITKQRVGSLVGFMPLIEAETKTRGTADVAGSDQSAEPAARASSGVSGCSLDADKPPGWPPSGKVEAAIQNRKGKTRAGELPLKIEYEVEPKAANSKAGQKLLEGASVTVELTPKTGASAPVSAHDLEQGTNMASARSHETIGAELVRGVNSFALDTLIDSADNSEASTPPLPSGAPPRHLDASLLAAECEEEQIASHTLGRINSGASTAAEVLGIDTEQHAIDWSSTTQRNAGNRGLPQPPKTMPVQPMTADLGRTSVGTPSAIISGTSSPGGGPKGPTRTAAVMPVSTVLLDTQTPSVPSETKDENAVSVPSTQIKNIQTTTLARKAALGAGGATAPILDKLTAANPVNLASQVVTESTAKVARHSSVPPNPLGVPITGTPSRPVHKPVERAEKLDVVCEDPSMEQTDMSDVDSPLSGTPIGAYGQYSAVCEDTKACDAVQPPSDLEVTQEAASHSVFDIRTKSTEDGVTADALHAIRPLLLPITGTAAVLEANAACEAISTIALPHRAAPLSQSAAVLETPHTSSEEVQISSLPSLRIEEYIDGLTQEAPASQGLPAANAISPVELHQKQEPAAADAGQPPQPAVPSHASLKHESPTSVAAQKGVGSHKHTLLSDVLHPLEGMHQGLPAALDINHAAGCEALIVTAAAAPLLLQHGISRDTSQDLNSPRSTHIANRVAESALNRDHVAAVDSNSAKGHTAGQILRPAAKTSHEMQLEEAAMVGAMMAAAEAVSHPPRSESFAFMPSGPRTEDSILQMDQTVQILQSLAATPNKASETDLPTVPVGKPSAGAQSVSSKRNDVNDGSVMNPAAGQLYDRDGAEGSTGKSGADHQDMSVGGGRGIKAGSVTQRDGLAQVIGTQHAAVNPQELVQGLQAMSKGDAVEEDTMPLEKTLASQQPSLPSSKGLHSAENTKAGSSTETASEITGMFASADSTTDANSQDQSRRKVSAYYFSNTPTMSPAVRKAPQSNPAGGASPSADASARTSSESLSSSQQAALPSHNTPPEGTDTSALVPTSMVPLGVDKDYGTVHHTETRAIQDDADMQLADALGKSLSHLSQAAPPKPLTRLASVYQANPADYQPAGTNMVEDLKAIHVFGSCGAAIPEAEVQSGVYEAPPVPESFSLYTPDPSADVGCISPVSPVSPDIVRAQHTVSRDSLEELQAHHVPPAAIAAPLTVAAALRYSGQSGPVFDPIPDGIEDIDMHSSADANTLAAISSAILDSLTSQPSATDRAIITSSSSHPSGTDREEALHTEQRTKPYHSKQGDAEDQAAAADDSSSTTHVEPQREGKRRGFLHKLRSSFRRDRKGDNSSKQLHAPLAIVPSTATGSVPEEAGSMAGTAPAMDAPAGTRAANTGVAAPTLTNAGAAGSLGGAAATAGVVSATAAALTAAEAGIVLTSTGADKEQHRAAGGGGTVDESVHATIADGSGASLAASGVNMVHQPQAKQSSDTTTANTDAAHGSVATSASSAMQLPATDPNPEVAPTVRSFAIGDTSGSDSGRSTPSYAPAKDFVLPAIEELEAFASHRVAVSSTNSSRTSSRSCSPVGRAPPPAAAVRALDLPPVPELAGGDVATPSSSTPCTDVTVATVGPPSRAAQLDGQTVTSCDDTSHSVQEQLTANGAGPQQSVASEAASATWALGSTAQHPAAETVQDVEHSNTIGSVLAMSVVPAIAAATESSPASAAPTTPAALQPSAKELASMQGPTQDLPTLPDTAVAADVMITDVVTKTDAAASDTHASFTAQQQESNLPDIESSTLHSNLQMSAAEMAAATDAGGALGGQTHAVTSAATEMPSSISTSIAAVAAPMAQTGINSVTLADIPGNIRALADNIQTSVGRSPPVTALAAAPPAVSSFALTDLPDSTRTSGAPPPMVAAPAVAAGTSSMATESSVGATTVHTAVKHDLSSVAEQEVQTAVRSAAVPDESLPEAQPTALPAASASAVASIENNETKSATVITAAAASVAAPHAAPALLQGPASASVAAQTSALSAGGAATTAAAGGSAGLALAAGATTAAVIASGSVARSAATPTPRASVAAATGAQGTEGKTRGVLGWLMASFKKSKPTNDSIVADPSSGLSHVRPNEVAVAESRARPGEAESPQLASTNGALGKGVRAPPLPVLALPTAVTNAEGNSPAGTRTTTGPRHEPSLSGMSATVDMVDKQQGNTALATQQQQDDDSVEAFAPATPSTAVGTAQLVADRNDIDEQSSARDVQLKDMVSSHTVTTIEPQEVETQSDAMVRTGAHGTFTSHKVAMADGSPLSSGMTTPAGKPPSHDMECLSKPTTDAEVQQFSCYEDEYPKEYTDVPLGGALISSKTSCIDDDDRWTDANDILSTRNTSVLGDTDAWTDALEGTASRAMSSTGDEDRWTDIDVMLGSAASVDNDQSHNDDLGRPDIPSRDLSLVATIPITGDELKASGVAISTGSSFSFPVSTFPQSGGQPLAHEDTLGTFGTTSRPLDTVDEQPSSNSKAAGPSSADAAFLQGGSLAATGMTALGAGAVAAVAAASVAPGPPASAPGVAYTSPDALQAVEPKVTSHDASAVALQGDGETLTANKAMTTGSSVLPSGTLSQPITTADCDVKTAPVTADSSVAAISLAADNGATVTAYTSSTAVNADAAATSTGGAFIAAALVSTATAASSSSASVAAMPIAKATNASSVATPSTSSAAAASMSSAAGSTLVTAGIGALAVASTSFPASHNIGPSRPRTMTEANAKVKPGSRIAEFLKEKKEMQTLMAATSQTDQLLRPNTPPRGVSRRSTSKLNQTPSIKVLLRTTSAPAPAAAAASPPSTTKLQRRLTKRESMQARRLLRNATVAGQTSATFALGTSLKKSEAPAALHTLGGSPKKTEAAAFLLHTAQSSASSTRDRSQTVEVSAAAAPAIAAAIPHLKDPMLERLLLEAVEGVYELTEDYSHVAGALLRAHSRKVPAAQVVNKKINPGRMKRAKTAVQRKVVGSCYGRPAK